MPDVARARRLAVRIREIVASTLEMQVKDPRLGMITITDARVTPDLREATVFYTVFGDEQDRAGTAAALDSARGVLRTQVGRQTGVKFTPSLTFIADVVPETARSVEELLAKARDADEEVRRASAGADYAGDPDPYKPEPAEDDEDETVDAAAAQDRPVDWAADGGQPRGWAGTGGQPPVGRPGNGGQPAGGDGSSGSAAGPSTA
jgi:ribosome-binding factor A